MRTRRNRFRNVAGVANAAVGDQRHTGSLQRFGHTLDRGDLRHTDTRDDTRGANRTGTDADFHTVSAVIQQSQCRATGGDVAADHLDVRKISLDPLDAIQHTLRMTVRRIHHDHVHACLGQQRDTLIRAHAHAYRCADTKVTEAVFASQRMLAGFQDVLYRHQTTQLECVVHHHYALDTMFVHQVARLYQTGVLLDGDQSLKRGHDILYRLIQIALETQIAVGDNPDQLLALHHRQTGNLVLARQTQHVAHRHIRRDSDGILDHAALKTFDLGDLGRLCIGRHILVDDADAAFLRQGDRQARLGDGIHRRGQQRDVQIDVAGKLRAQTDITR